MSVGAVQGRLQNTAMPKDCPTPAEMDPLSGSLGVQTCTGGPGHTSFHGKGLVDALAVGMAALTFGGSESDEGLASVSGALLLLPLLYLVVAKLRRPQASWPALVVLITPSSPCRRWT